MEEWKSFVDRLRDRLYWIWRTTRLGGDVSSKAKLLLGGVWLLLNDSWKSRLQFTARIQRDGRALPFQFSDIGEYGLICEIFCSDTYDHEGTREADVIFDLGANVGVSALYFRLRFPAATIHCFEPDPANLRRLRANAQLLGQVHVYEFAVWRTRTSLSFHVDPHRGSSSSAYASHSRQEEVNVNARPLVDAFEAADVDKVDLLKFDVEGAEEDIFEAFDEFGRIQAVAGEVHGDYCDADAVLQTMRLNFDRVDIAPMGIEDRWYVTARRAGEGG
jgi:FkbM family methyltransferase